MANEIFIQNIGQVGVKVEASEGTAETPATGDLFLAEELVFKPNVQATEREPIRLYTSDFTDVTAGRSATLSFKTLLKGQGAAGSAPEYGDLFKGCKFQETISGGVSVEYTPISSDDSSLTLVFYQAINSTTGKKWVLNGCRGTFTMGFVNGEPMYINWEFTAADWTESDAAPLSNPTYETAAPLVFQNATFTIDSNTFEVSKLDIDAGNAVNPREDVTKSSGKLSYVVTSVQPVGAIDPQDVLVATYDLFGKWRSGATGALNLVVSGGAGNIVTITAPAVQYTDITPGERNEIRTVETNLKFTRSTGNDHLSIAFT